MANEKPENWLENTKKYCNKPIDQNIERVGEINEIACQHDIDMESASILYASKEKLNHE